MQYLEGETLTDRIRRPEGLRLPGEGSGRPSGLPVEEALKVAIQIASALDTAHRAGIVHRDLKPGNIMLVRRGGPSGPPDAKLLDFGLAKVSTPAVAVAASMAPTTPPGMTAQGTILGTFQYMAPEQIEGLDVDARTDIFAFGAVLFEMLTGRPAFEGKTRASLLGAILKDEPPPISKIRPGAPAALDRIVATCLAKEPDDRWQTARDLLRELKWVADGTIADAGAAAGMATPGGNAGDTTPGLGRKALPWRWPACVV
jgi:serine/threonine protein kinase